MRVATPLLALILLAGAASAARVGVSLVGRPPVLTAGKPWTAKLAVRPASFRGTVRVIAGGPEFTSRAELAGSVPNRIVPAWCAVAPIGMPLCM